MRILALLAAAAVGYAQPPAKPLRIVNVTLHQYEDGPPLPPGYQFIPGETVFFSFEVQGYRVSPEQKVRMTYAVDVLDSDGVRLVETNAGKLETELTDRDKDWQPKIRHSFLIPPYALSGEFRITALVKDGISSQEAKAEVPFTVRGRALKLSPTLAVEDVRFLRTEEDRDQLIAPVYKPGDTLWVRFDITGFKAGEQNRMDVLYGISIVSPAGKVLYSEPRAAEEKDAPFYPRRYVPGAFNLNVQPKTTPGEYTLVITARDEVGQQTCESRNQFRIE